MWRWWPTRGAGRGIARALGEAGATVYCTGRSVTGARRRTWAAELAPHGVAVIAITPGFLRSESMPQHFGVPEDNWREAGRKDSNFLESESPLFLGVAAGVGRSVPHRH